MDKKIEAARNATGLIELKDNGTADDIKAAVEKVSQIISVEDNMLTFEGERVIEGAGFALEVNCFDIYKCSKGYLLHTYMNNGENWAVSGKTVQQTLRAAPDQRVAKRAHGIMVQKGLAPLRDH